ncbi:hypothetical protein FRC10_010694 [Ceratobasidium sp. 414]|nr:hypothetical protein FRC10_010694 [Ceratobasidium sp. 414]
MSPNNDWISLGKEMQAMSDDALLTLRKKANDGEWEPTLFERLNRPSTHAGVAARDAKHRESYLLEGYIISVINAPLTQLKIGHINGRSEHARKIREALPTWEEFDPPLGDRSTRGVKHRRCATLLGLPTLEWEDKE